MNDLRFAFRQLLKNPGFTAVAVLTLALGIGANTAIFSLINFFLLKPLVVRQPERLVGIYSRELERAGSWRPFSIPNFEDLRAHNDIFADIFAMRVRRVGIREGETTRRVLAVTASANYFEVLGVRPLLGRSFLLEENHGPAATVMVSCRWWEQRGSDPAIVGQALEINGRPHIIVGVTPPGFSGTTPLPSPDLFLPMGSNLLGLTGDSNPLEQRDKHDYMLVGRLKDGLDISTANTRLRVVSAQLGSAFPDVNRNQVIIADRLPRTGIAMNPTNNRAQLAILSALVSLPAVVVLVIVCLNLANMLLARGESRRQEFAIRLAIGAKPGQIVRQLVVEGFLLALAGGVIGLVLSTWMLSLVSRSIETHTSFGLAIPTVTDWRVMFMTFGVCVLATLIFALVPAVRLVRRGINDDLKAGGSPRRDYARESAFTLRSLHVTGQMALSLALMVAAGLFVRSAINARQFNPGLDLNRGFYVEIDAGLLGYTDEQASQRYDEVLERIRRMPGVESASVAASIPLGELTLGERVQSAGAPRAANTTAESEAINSGLNLIGSDYFRTIGLPLERGREFTRAEMDPSSQSKVAIINTVLSRQLWPGEEALGKRLHLGGDGGTTAVSNDEAVSRATVLEVVGIVPPLKNGLFERTETPMLFLPFARRFSSVLLHVRAAPAAGVESLLVSARDVIRQVDSKLPVLRTETLRSHVANSQQTQAVQMGAVALGYLGGVAMLLAMLGVYGVQSYRVAQRTREIGIRMALGASAGQVLKSMVGEGAKLAIGGLAIGGVLALGVTLALGSVLIGVPRFDPFVLVAMPLLLAGALLLACWFPARRAASVDPMEALRCE